MISKLSKICQSINRWKKTFKKTTLQLKLKVYFYYKTFQKRLKINLENTS